MLATYVGSRVPINNNVLQKMQKDKIKYDKPRHDSARCIGLVQCSPYNRSDNNIKHNIKLQPHPVNLNRIGCVVSSLVLTKALFCGALWCSG